MKFVSTALTSEYFIWDCRWKLLHTCFIRLNSYWTQMYNCNLVLDLWNRWMWIYFLQKSLQNLPAFKSVPSCATVKLHTQIRLNVTMCKQWNIEQLGRQMISSVDKPDQSCIILKGGCLQTLLVSQSSVSTIRLSKNHGSFGLTANAHDFSLPHSISFILQKVDINIL